jgi:hypothetical protein
MPFMRKDFTNILQPSVDVDRALDFAQRNAVGLYINDGAGFIDTQTAIRARKAGMTAPRGHGILTLEKINAIQYNSYKAQDALRIIAK